MLCQSRECIESHDSLAEPEPHGHLLGFWDGQYDGLIPCFANDGTKPDKRWTFTFCPACGAKLPPAA